MKFLRLPVKDPRTVARDIPGICDLLFPQLLPAIVSHLNREAKPVPGCSLVENDLVSKTSANAAMLFEVAYALSEQLLDNANEDWEKCLQIAHERQSKYFDVELLENLSDFDISVAKKAAGNLKTSLIFFQRMAKNTNLVQSPLIPGYQWIAHGRGDFSIGTTLIEVKCSSRSFSSSDYRQLLIYWLLSFSSSIEGSGEEWKSGILLNPRLNRYVEFKFDDLIRVAGAGRSKIEILELFSSLVGDYVHKLGAEL